MAVVRLYVVVEDVLQDGVPDQLAGIQLGANAGRGGVRWRLQRGMASPRSRRRGAAPFG
ncbi:MAG TPA: hypothetical protein VHN80_28790 [Kineosporiaceae bacterium]|nr:hypothetical protein [Kineosporiaceae bacterium]